MSSPNDDGGPVAHAAGAGQPHPPPLPPQQPPPRPRIRVTGHQASEEDRQRTAALIAASPTSAPSPYSFGSVAHRSVDTLHGCFVSTAFYALWGAVVGGVFGRFLHKGMGSWTRTAKIGAFYVATYGAGQCYFAAHVDSKDYGRNGKVSK
jgi:hypothetical protein